MASAIAYITLGCLLGLLLHNIGFAIVEAVSAAIIDAQGLRDTGNQPLDLIDGDIRPASLLSFHKDAF